MKFVLAAMLRKTFITWIAFFAILFGALAPSVSLALAAKNAQAASWVEICSIGGMRFMQINDQSSDSSAPLEHGLHMEDCPFCFSHASTLGLPPSSKYLIPLMVGTLTLPSLFYQSPHPLFIWNAAQSRAPPLLS